jgi:hypothetical protein
MRMTVEIFSAGSLVDTIVIEARSVEAAKAAAQNLVDAADLPVQGYRIVTEEGQELLPYQDRKGH